MNPKTYDLTPDLRDEIMKMIVNCLVAASVCPCGKGSSCNSVVIGLTMVSILKIGKISDDVVNRLLDRTGENLKVV
jgi:hypothetical protein